MFAILKKRYIPLFLSIFVFLTGFFTSFTSVNAVEMTGNTDESDMGVDIDNSDDVASKKSSSVPDLGDDQTFPFIPGFGKNSGKD